MPLNQQDRKYQTGFPNRTKLRIFVEKIRRINANDDDHDGGDDDRRGTTVSLL
jgi:hypothetical protein